MLTGKQPSTSGGYNSLQHPIWWAVTEKDVNIRWLQPTVTPHLIETGKGHQHQMATNHNNTPFDGYIGRESSMSGGYNQLL